MIIVDTGFLSSLYKINRLELIKKHFKVDYVVISNATFIELSKTKFFTDLMRHIAIDEDLLDEKYWILIKKSDIKISDGRLGNGEKEAISIALVENNQDVLLLIDDRTARAVAKREGIMTATLPEFLLDCPDTGEVDGGRGGSRGFFRVVVPDGSCVRSQTSHSHPRSRRIRTCSAYEVTNSVCSASPVASFASRGV
jgi:predicted nucleic acid-binding protein